MLIPAHDLTEQSMNPQSPLADAERFAREAQQTVERGGVPEFKSVDDVIAVIGFLAARHSEQPVVVIDEFERIKDERERSFFADFIKQCGDQSLPVKFIFCGIGTALSDLLDAHHSCYRCLTAVELERLGLDPRLEIIANAVRAFGLQVEDTTAYRIAMISDGFPHYVHLITEKLCGRYSRILRRSR
jgi:uncharacterized protein